MHSRGSLGRTGLARSLVILFVATIWAFAAATASGQGQEEERVRQGEATFGQVCGACHTVGGGTLIGPDLQGVTERREEAWLKVHILSPSIHHRQNDPISVANREEYGLQMPDPGLTEPKVEAVIAYLKTAATAPAITPTLYAPTLIAGVLGVVALTILGLYVGRKKVEVRS